MNSRSRRVAEYDDRTWCAARARCDTSTSVTDRATRTASGFRNRRSSPKLDRLLATSAVNALNGQPTSRSRTPVIAATSRVTTDDAIRRIIGSCRCMRTPLTRSSP